MRTKESNDDVRGEKMTLRAGSVSCRERERESLLFFYVLLMKTNIIHELPAVQPWSCHPEDYHFTQHLTETQRETKSRKKAAGRKREERDKGKERLTEEKRKHNNNRAWLEMRWMCLLGGIIISV